MMYALSFALDYGFVVQRAQTAINGRVVVSEQLAIYLSSGTVVINNVSSHAMAPAPKIATSSFSVSPGLPATASERPHQDPGGLWFHVRHSATFWGTPGSGCIVVSTTTLVPGWPFVCIAFAITLCSYRRAKARRGFMVSDRARAEKGAKAKNSSVESSWAYAMTKENDTDQNPVDGSPVLPPGADTEQNRAAFAQNVIDASRHVSAQWTAGLGRAYDGFFTNSDTFIGDILRETRGRIGNPSVLRKTVAYGPKE